MAESYSQLGGSTLCLLVLCAGLLLLASCITIQPPPLPPSPYKHWAAYYGKDAPTEVFSGYDVVVFDADHHPYLPDVQKHGTKVLAYLSVAEIDPHRSYAERFLSLPGMKLAENERWKSSVIDIRHPEWQAFIVDEWLPDVLAQGFDGVFLDTIDTALHLQMQDEKYRDLDQAAIQIVQKIRGKMHKEIPSKKLIMVNRSFDILPEIAGDIDIILAESILIDAEKPGKPYFPPDIHGQYIDILQGVRQKHSQLSIFTLDYPETIDKTTWLQVCSKHKKHGFVPYISTMDLQQITPPFERCGYRLSKKAVN